MPLISKAVVLLRLHPLWLVVRVDQPVLPAPQLLRTRAVLPLLPNPVLQLRPQLVVRHALATEAF